MDAEIYRKKLEQMGHKTFHIQTYDPENDQTKIIQNCDYIFAFEEIGSEEVAQAMIKSSRLRNLYYVVNLETIYPEAQKYAPTLKYWEFVSIFINKTHSPEFKRLLPYYETKNIQHYTLVEGNADVKNRKNLLHFAGFSPFKNTIQSIKAGIQLLDKFDEFNIVISRSKKGFLLGEKNINEIYKLCNHEKINLIIGPISNEEKIKLYNSTKLAICASNAEGFGHYICEAIYFGCQVITTNGFPMNTFAENDQIYLAEPTETVNHNKGLWYNVPAKNIVQAFKDIKYEPQKIQQIYQNIKNQFNTDFETFEFERSKYAYVFLVMKGDNYIPGALVAGHSLRLQTKYDIVCMVTNDVSVEGIIALKKVFTQVIQIDYIEMSVKKMHTEKQQKMYEKWTDVAATKWNCLKLTQYDKILFLDADMLFFRNIDHLFEMNAPAGIFSSPWAEPYTKGMKNPYKGLNHGDKIPYSKIQKGFESFIIAGSCVLLKPDLNDFERLTLLSKTPNYGHPNCNNVFDEQILCDTLKDWTYMHQNYSAIPWKKNWMDDQLPYSFHYFNIKPWVLGRKAYHDIDPWYVMAFDLIDKIPYLKSYFLDDVYMTPSKKCCFCEGKHQFITGNQLTCTKFM